MFLSTLDHNYLWYQFRECTVTVTKQAGRLLEESGSWWKSFLYVVFSVYKHSTLKVNASVYNFLFLNQKVWDIKSNLTSNRYISNFYQLSTPTREYLLLQCGNLCTKKIKREFYRSLQLFWKNFELESSNRLETFACASFIAICCWSEP